MHMRILYNTELFSIVVFVDSCMYEHIHRLVWRPAIITDVHLPEHPEVGLVSLRPCIQPGLPDSADSEPSKSPIVHGQFVQYQHR